MMHSSFILHTSTYASTDLALVFRWLQYRDPEHAFPHGKLQPYKYIYIYIYIYTLAFFTAGLEHFIFCCKARFCCNAWIWHTPLHHFNNGPRLFIYGAFKDCYGELNTPRVCRTCTANLGPIDPLSKIWPTLHLSTCQTKDLICH